MLLKTSCSFIQGRIPRSTDTLYKLTAAHLIKKPNFLENLTDHPCAKKIPKMGPTPRHMDPTHMIFVYDPS